MHAFGESFCQTIRQRLHQNRRIIVIIRFEAQHMLVNAVSGRNGQAADPIILRQDEVGQAHIGLPLPLPDLLAKEWHADHFASGWLYQHVLRSEEHTSELQTLMRNSYDVFCLKKQKSTHRSK